MSSMRLDEPPTESSLLSPDDDPRHRAAYSVEERGGGLFDFVRQSALSPASTSTVSRTMFEDR